MKKLTFTHTLGACFTGYIVQAIVNLFAPLLFVTFGNSYGIPLSGITLLITLNFAIQLTVDLMGTFIVDKMGYKATAIAANFTAAAGLILLSFLPDLIDPYAGILLSVIVYSAGGGLFEIVMSPIVEACPTKNKDRVMALLHSSYCWGSVIVIGLSTVWFEFVGIDKWQLLSLMWAILPVLNGVFFFFVPIVPLIKEGERGLKLGELLKNGYFWLFAAMMLAAGSAEQAVSQWASSFAESGLGVSKTTGDLVGPLSLSVLMGVARVLYARFGGSDKLMGVLLCCAALTVGAYLMAALSGNAVAALVGVALTGFGTGIMWPGTFSLASGAVKGGGTAMFALLAFAGDAGCMLGPTLVGRVADAAGGDLSSGIAAGTVFPAMMAVLVVILMILRGRERRKNDLTEIG